MKYRVAEMLQRYCRDVDDILMERDMHLAESCNYKSEFSVSSVMYYTIIRSIILVVYCIIIYVCSILLVLYVGYCTRQ